ncbi:hypothetical protein [Antarcticibacterium arcticum]|nr:hypothetical protein [Antarcticibacterium arcticum]
MKFNLILVFIVLFMGACPHGFSQGKKNEDENLKLYKGIEEFSKKTKLTKFIHKLVFRPTGSNPQANFQKRQERSYKKYHGKIIRNIEINVLDPFGRVLKDTAGSGESWIEKTGNSLHIRTHKGVIRDLLLFELNKPLDSLLIRESERLIRSQSFIRSAAITAENTTASDSVDVFVQLQDAWSIIPEGSFSTSKTTLGVRERNFLGTGHDLRTHFTRHFELGENAYDVQYTIRNFKNTFINTSLGYSSFLDNSYYKGINIERIFYSPFARWAGGIYLDQQLRKDSLATDAYEMSSERLRYNTYDFWGGHSFRIFKGASENDRTTNLITSARLLRVEFKESPGEEMDPDNFFSSETFYMGSLGISSRQFVKDQYIFNYGIIEDVPVGTIYGITGGYQKKNNTERLYLGGRVAYGNYFSWGFISSNFEAGSFFRGEKAEQATFSFQANYFTNLINIGPHWKVRQFVKPQLLWGSNRLNTIGDRITLNENGSLLGLYGANFPELEGIGIPGYNSRLYGSQKFLLTFQTQFYSPWNMWGFRLNPFLKYSFAMLGDKNNRLPNGKVYNSIGAGFIISNDYLVFDVFQLSFAFFPRMPGQGSDIFRFNAFNTTDFGFQDFEFGKPRTVLYR